MGTAYCCIPKGEISESGRVLPTDAFQKNEMVGERCSETNLPPIQTYTLSSLPTATQSQRASPHTNPEASFTLIMISNQQTDCQKGLESSSLVSVLLPASMGGWIRGLGAAFDAGLW